MANGAKRVNNRETLHACRLSPDARDAYV